MSYHKTCLWLLACILMTACLSSVGLAANPNLVGWWSFNEGAGDVAADGSGNGNDGTLVNTTWEAGQLGSALGFDGSAYVDVPPQAWASISAQFTCAFWVYIPTADISQSNFIVGAFSDPANNEARVFSAHLPWAGNTVYYDTSGPAYDRTSKAISPAELTDAWNHWAFTKNADTGAVMIYRNGELWHSDTGKVKPLQGADITKFTIGTKPSLAEGWFRGMIDDVQLYNVALSQEEIQEAMQGISLEQAVSPVPEAEDVDVLRDTVLAWSPGKFAATHNVYVGTSFEDVNSATGPTASGLAVNSFDPGRLDFGQTYFWRVDEVNGTPDKTVYKGEIWSFTVEPYSIQIPGSSIVATASSSANEFSQPEKSIDGSGLDGAVHSISPEAMWFTASVDLDPWIEYEFDGVRQLDTMKVWNSNGAAEIAIGWGVKDVEIAYSVDGVTWDVLETANQFSRAPGSATYDQYDEIPFGGVPAKYVRFNIASNWGGILMSYSLSEVQFFMIPAQARTPVPASGAADVVPGSVATWRVGREAAQHTIYASTEADAVADGSALSVSSSTNSVDLSSLDLRMSTTYYWRVDEVNEAEATLVWAGPVWSFTTAAALIVDDFESYSNDSPDRPFQTWLDGFGYSDDEFFPVAYAGNGTGAGIGHDIWSLSSPHYNGKIMETSNTLPGSGQSMPFYYSNSGGVSSETQRKFAMPQDWTVGGAITLSIPFSGQTGNTGTLYAKINGVKVVYPRDPANLAANGWLAFNIDLTSMNVKNVTELAIGVDGSNASGLLLIDDITLHATPGKVITPEDPGNDNLVGAWSFDEGSGTGVADNSGNGHTGTIVGATWDIGKQGSALLFGETDYVQTGYAGPTGTVSRTCAAWIKTADANRSFMSWGLNTAGKKWRVRLDATGGLRIEVNGGYHYGQTFLADDEWHHVAVVLEDDGTPDVAETLLYVDGLSEATSAVLGKAIDTDATGEVRIGKAPYDATGFIGLVDDARIYERVLSEAEIMGLAGRQAPIDKLF